MLTKFINKFKETKEKIISDEKEFENKWNGTLVKHKLTDDVLSIIVIPKGVTMAEMIKRKKYNPLINITYATYSLYKDMYELVDEKVPSFMAK